MKAFGFFLGHVDFIFSTNARNLLFILIVTVFLDVEDSGFLSLCSGHMPKCVNSLEAMGNLRLHQTTTVRHRGLVYDISGDACEKPGLVWIMLESPDREWP